MNVRIGAAILLVAVLAFIGAYVVRPQLQRTSVALPKTCSPSALGAGSVTVLLADDGIATVTAHIDASKAPFPSSVYLTNKNGRRVLWGGRFENDIISAAVDRGVLYLYNDKIAEWIDARTGKQVPEIFTIDNFGGLSSKDRPVLPQSDTGRWYLETTAIVSRWNRDLSVDLYHRVTFNGIAFNCFVEGSTGGVKALW